VGKVPPFAKPETVGLDLVGAVFSENLRNKL
jgi:hypothetical protein